MTMMANDKNKNALPVEMLRSITSPARNMATIIATAAISTRISPYSHNGAIRYASSLHTSARE